MDSELLLHESSSADSSIKNEEESSCVLTSLSSSHLVSIPYALETVDRFLEVRLASTAVLESCNGDCEKNGLVAARPGYLGARVEGNFYNFAAQSDLPVNQGGYNRC